VDSVPGMAAEAVLATSQELAPDTDKVSGYDFNRGIDHHELLKSFKYSGFQATNFGLAVEEIWRMIRCREEDIPADKLEISKMKGVEKNCTIFLGYTSNMASCGVRETIRYLVQHKIVSWPRLGEWRRTLSSVSPPHTWGTSVCPAES